ncbi:MAG: crotonase/enoyl-CoA hydratase family protein [Kiloniellales bacterium]
MRIQEHRGPDGAVGAAPDLTALPATARSTARERAAIARAPWSRRRETRHGPWLDEARAFGEIDVAFDGDDGILWCYMNPRGRPSVTATLAGESRSLQRLVAERQDTPPLGDSLPVRYMVWGSRLPGIFNLGGDLALFAQLIRARDRQRLIDYATACIDVVYMNAVNLDRPLITVSLVQGDALGGGFEAAISSNVVIAERRAKFGLPEVLFNLFPGMGAYSLIARKIGAAAAERMIFSGRVYSAPELYDLGLVDELAEDGAGEETVHRFIAQNSRRHAARCSVYRAGRLVNPISYQELQDIAVLWVDTALKLDESDLKRMARLAAAQDRRLAEAAD